MPITPVVVPPLFPLTSLPLLLLLLLHIVSGNLSRIRRPVTQARLRNSAQRRPVRQRAPNGRKTGM
jgi:hypothetical protein